MINKKKIINDQYEIDLNLNYFHILFSFQYYFLVITDQKGDLYLPKTGTGIFAAMATTYSLKKPWIKDILQKMQPVNA